MHTLHFLKFKLQFFVINNEFAKFNSRRVVVRTFFRITSADYLKLTYFKKLQNKVYNYFILHRE